MHDPLTVAFDIKYPWKSRRLGNSKLWPNGYRDTFITIWHKDPMNFENKIGVSSDDSCGWHTPPYSKEEREHMRKVSARQYEQIFAMQYHEAKGDDWFRACNDPDCLSAIYWSWRAIGHELRPREVWQYDRAPTRAELTYIYELATNPVDNLQSLFQSVQGSDTFEDLFMCVFRAYTRFNRPWYRHPRWHIHHWRIQVRPLQKLTRWLFKRCEKCGERLGYNEIAIGSWNGDGIWHQSCAYEGVENVVQSGVGSAVSEGVRGVAPGAGS